MLRHSCAVALLQAGVDITVIRDYLGHASVTTTSRCVTTNLEMKEQVLEDRFVRRIARVDATQSSSRLRPGRDRSALSCLFRAIAPVEAAPVEARSGATARIR